jgi:RimJ/RimL family protein N-acetyltransferase
MPAFDTPRLRLRPWTMSDLDDYARVFAKPQALAFQRDTGLTPAEALEHLRHNIACRPGNWAIVPRRAGIPIGWVSLETTDQFPGAPPGIQLGCRLDPDHWRKGYATEASRAILAHAFHTLGLSQVYLLFHRDNHRSAGLAAKLGAQPLTTLTDRSGAHLREVHIIRTINQGSVPTIEAGPGR